MGDSWHVVDYFAGLFPYQAYKLMSIPVNWNEIQVEIISFFYYIIFVGHYHLDIDTDRWIMLQWPVMVN